MKILLVENDTERQKLLRAYLENEGYEVILSYEKEEILFLVTCSEIKLVIIDAEFLNEDKVELCHAIRSSNHSVKILLLTCDNSSLDELKILIAGADDYIIKPYDISVLLVRIRKMLIANSLHIYGQLTLNTETCEVRKKDEIVNLTRKEYELLCYFMNNINIVLSRAQILDYVWGMNYEGDERTVDTHVKRLRRKIGSSYIVTKIGMGYLMGYKSN
ncbi:MULTISPECIES: response regulator transcription factor [Vagococcus]|uniref:Two-component response regulator n=1 Tax=Vagococcus fluvialis bH819 TaxID=1255619 RepID=A0A1X6WLR0_9ENTE|nr:MULTISPECIES: response regulator transcription factor [Vagococcus]SLM84606.1 Two-component response regulator [Vagococcus fluvialis bH819]HCM89930.1 DNA-binding response regulator [Vagococcus sp.]